MPALSRFASLALAARFVAAQEPVVLVQKDLRLHDEAKPKAEPEGAAMLKAWPDFSDPSRTPTMEEQMAIREMRSHLYHPEVVLERGDKVAFAPPWWMTKAHGYDMLFHALEVFEDPMVHLMALRSLSDQARTEVGGEAIANWNGKQGQGIRKIVKALVDHPKAHLAEAGHRTYQYEALQTLASLLQHDKDGSRTTEALKAGLLEQVAHVMEVEADRRASQDAACRITSTLVKRDPSLAEQARKLGIQNLAKKARMRYHPIDDTPFRNGATFSESFPAAANCDALIQVL